MFMRDIYDIYHVKPGPCVDYNELIKPILNEMVRRLVKHFNPIKIILFGSYARREPHHTSDVDLLVVVDGPVNTYEKAVKMRDVLDGLGVEKDIKVTTPERIKEVGDDVGYVIYYALKEGVMLYER